LWNPYIKITKEKMLEMLEDMPTRYVFKMSVSVGYPGNTNPTSSYDFYESDGFT